MLNYYTKERKEKKKKSHSLRPKVKGYFFFFFFLKGDNEYFKESFSPSFRKASSLYFARRLKVSYQQWILNSATIDSFEYLHQNVSFPYALHLALVV